MPKAPVKKNHFTDEVKKESGSEGKFKFSLSELELKRQEKDGEEKYKKEMSSLSHPLIYGVLYP